MDKEMRALLTKDSKGGNAEGDAKAEGEDDGEGSGNSGDEDGAPKKEVRKK